MEAIPPPDSRELLPPLLACLSTASTAPDAPVGLLPLLSPILRQRLQLLACRDWLALLCWDRHAGARLPGVLQQLHLEPHPASGEIEVDEPDLIVYRRSDPETLHARLVLGALQLLPTYLWCTGGEGGNRWLLAELRATEDAEDGTAWFAGMGEANEAGFRRKEPAREADEDDGSYWAAYDRTPARTPQQKHSPAPVQSELEYFARYASEGRPALDAHDPDEENPATGESTLDGRALRSTRNPQFEPLETSNLGPNGYDSSMPPVHRSNDADGQHGVQRMAAAAPPGQIDFSALNHPRPSSSASTNSVERLARKAEHYSQAEIAIKQHISTDIKSLFRLAKASGIDREEFESIVKRELDVLPLLEQEQ
ncbi:hypothetical protein BDU57DRAFT_560305 [Ampelomyces quisqualis]|uniref:Uncharacterized protein n=1 Tax=Ampelomyces quisqualis TaxID=50730 RepID=A0A6A5Q7U7_AMPQU|nr:hypothetical protein BDU57DRAFT_560305 [Ampelomyces quisqualis]